MQKNKAPLVIAVLSISAGFASVIGMSPAPFAPPASVDSSADLNGLGETRLRKLHLVRPDLIPYPLASKTYC